MLVSHRNLPFSAPGAGTTSMCFQAQLFLMWVLGSHWGPHARVVGSSLPLLFKAFLCSQEEIPYLLFWLWRQACVVQPRPASCLCPCLGGGGVRHHTCLLLFAFVGSQNCKRCSFWLSVSKAPASPPTSPAFSFFMDCSGLVSPAAR